MKSNKTHLMFIDSDIEFKPEDILTLWYFSILDEKMDIVCGAYPKKNISWEKILAAANKGLADENPNVLEFYAGDFAFNVIESKEYRLDEPMEVAEAGTGFMLIRRKAFEEFAKAHPERLYTPDSARLEGYEGSNKIIAYFDCIIDPESNRYLSEDYFFCQEIRKLGMRVWILPWIDLNHIGTYVFKGNLISVS